MLIHESSSNNFESKDFTANTANTPTRVETINWDHPLNMDLSMKQIDIKTEKVLPYLTSTEYKKKFLDRL